MSIDNEWIAEVRMAYKKIGAEELAAHLQRTDLLDPDSKQRVAAVVHEYLREGG